MKKLTLLLLLSLFALSGYAQYRDSVYVKNDIFEVVYSEVYEQPLWLIYKVRNIEKVADRKGMDFWVPEDIHTSDNKDYYKNVWDKGHLAPAAHFTDSKDNLYATFNYLNSALQHQRLNRGEWRMLEAEERKWVEEFGEMTVKVKVVFEGTPEVLETGATVPTGFYKLIWFDKTGEQKCFYFPNDNPDKEWEEYEISCEN